MAYVGSTWWPKIDGASISVMGHVRRARIPRRAAQQQELLLRTRGALPPRRAVASGLGPFAADVGAGWDLAAHLLTHWRDGALPLTHRAGSRVAAAADGLCSCGSLRAEQSAAKGGSAASGSLTSWFWNLCSCAMPLWGLDSCCIGARSARRRRVASVVGLTALRPRAPAQGSDRVSCRSARLI